MYRTRLGQKISDFFTFFKFKRSISKEIYQRDSLFNRFELKRNFIGNVIYLQVNFSEKDLMDADFNPNEMIRRKLAPIAEYLDKTLNWGEYLSMDVANFVDEKGNETLSYAVSFEYVGRRW